MVAAPKNCPDEKRPPRATAARVAALKIHIEKLSPNLIRAYLLDLIEDAPPAEIEKLIVAFGAQNAVQGTKA